MLFGVCGFYLVLLFLALLVRLLVVNITALVMTFNSAGENETKQTNIKR